MAPVDPQEQEDFILQWGSQNQSIGSTNESLQNALQGWLSHSIVALAREAQLKASTC